jgi:hypothetical protein
MQLRLKLIVLFTVFFSRAFSQDCATSGSMYIQTSESICFGEAAYFSPSCTDINNVTWLVDGSPVSSSLYFNYTFTTPGIHTVSLEYYTNSYSSYNYISETINILSTPATPSIQANKTSFCDSESNRNVTFSVSNAQSGVTYTWSSDPIGYSANGTSATFNNVSQNTRFTVTAGNGTCASYSDVMVTINKTIVSPMLKAEMPYHKRFVYSSAAVSYHYWQTTPEGVDQTRVVNGDLTVTEPGLIYIRHRNVSGCWANATGPLNVNTFNLTPPQPQVIVIKKYGYNEIVFTNDDKTHILAYADYYWVTNITGMETNRKFVQGDKIFSAGTYYLRGRDRGTGTWGQTNSITVQLQTDESLNWIHTTGYDGSKQNGQLVVTSEAKAFFDDTGKALQAQSRNFTDSLIFATETIHDKYGREVVSTMAAPIKRNTFGYNSGFVLNDALELYSYKDFDLASNIYQPAAVNNSIEGTLGWYYSVNNDIEPLTPETSYPYSRTEFYADATDGVKRAAGPGDQHRLGLGHDVLSGVFPVYNELDDYLLKRAIALPGIAQDGSLKNQGLQNVARDQNGKYAVSVSDKSGKGVFTARQGTPTDHTMVVNNSITANATPGNINYRPLIYLYLFHAQAVAITGTGTYNVQDIVTGEALIPNTLWPVGFYRVMLVSGEISIAYQNYFQDVSYVFYDNAGRLKSSISPNGFNQLKSGTNYSLIDKTTYEYDFQNRLLSTTEPDAGTSAFKYRKDGKIRFSQNASQAVNDDFSYTHYDKQGRPIESGEYIGSAYTYGNASSQLEFSSQVIFSNDIKDWIKTHYDYPSAAIDNLPSTFVQEYLRGAVSWTENANIKTWYSYDELGRVTWMAQKPLVLDRTFVTQYTYDFTGAVLSVKNSSYVNGIEQQPFYHHYEYDKDKRLKNAFTSIDGTSKKLRAHYEYYLHGPLKRIELGDNIQGIDFVYNIHGWLTQINHPDKAQDPGGDINDAFGMVLDYYESSIPGLITTSSLHDPRKFHNLSGGSPNSLAMQQPLIRFSPDISNELNVTNGMKEYSADNPRYKTMITESLQTENR